MTEEDVNDLKVPYAEYTLRAFTPDGKRVFENDFLLWDGPILPYLVKKLERIAHHRQDADHGCVLRFEHPIHVMYYDTLIENVVASFYELGRAYTTACEGAYGAFAPFDADIWCGDTQRAFEYLSPSRPGELYDFHYVLACVLGTQFRYCKF